MYKKDKIKIFLYLLYNVYFMYILCIIIYNYEYLYIIQYV